MTMIGIFDSGLGGLTVLKDIRNRLPQYDYLYLADSARAPYGGHSKETITEFSRQAANWLFDHGCNLVIFACNTASAQALRTLQQEWLPSVDKDPSKPKRILGVVRPLVETAMEITKGRVGVLATRATVESNAFVHELKKLRPDIVVRQNAAPLLVPLIEEGWIKRTVTRQILKGYLRPLKDANIDTLILGCTHYPLLISLLRPLLPNNVTILDAGPIVATKLVNYLKRHPEIETQLTKTGTTKFYTTDDPKRFATQAGRWWGQVIQAERATLL
jgi:glutamate racemase